MRISIATRDDQYMIVYCNVIALLLMQLDCRYVTNRNVC